MYKKIDFKYVYAILSHILHFILMISSYTWDIKRVYLRFNNLNSGDKGIFCVTGTRHACLECKQINDNNFKDCIMLGYTGNYDNWITLCQSHLSCISVNKQYCNICNNHALFGDDPHLCLDCLNYILLRNARLLTVCHIPNKCKCEFCLLR